MAHHAFFIAKCYITYNVVHRTHKLSSAIFLYIIRNLIII